jgi:oligoendopeptidase F
MKKKSPANKKVSDTAWDLEVLYTSAADKAIEHDITRFERTVDTFVRTFQKESKRFSEIGLLKQALAAYEKIAASPDAARSGYYFGLRRELDARDDEAEKKLNLLSDRLTKTVNKLLFFELVLGKLSVAHQTRILKDASLSKWHYYLKGIFDEAKHHLTEAEERIMSLKSNTSHGLWVAGTEKMLNRRTIAWKGKVLPLSEAFELISKLPKVDRRKLWSLAVVELKALGSVAENELTAIVLDKKVSDELRGFKNPYSATVLGYENSESSVEALIAAVKNNYHISARFYALKAKLMKEKRLLYADRSTAIGTSKKISFASATATLREVFHEVNPEYARILDTMLEHKQIDAFPRKGKTGGAFCASQTNLPTYVLLNHLPDSRSLMTYAHEMGHAVHAERSKTLTPIYQGHSTAVAETASTLFENLVFDANLRTLDRAERIGALHDKIQDDIAGIQRQVAFFEFEREMHHTIRTQGAMTEHELAACMQKHLSSYLGKAVEVTKDDGYSFVYVSHFRRFFYVYTYAYGNLISNAIAARLRSDATYTKEIDGFLTAGCSKSPEDIFKAMGIDVTKSSFFEEGLKKMSERIDELESLIK